MRRQLQLLARAVRARDSALQSDLEGLLADAVAPGLVHGAGVQAFMKAARRQRRAHAAAGVVAGTGGAGAEVDAAAAAAVSRTGIGPVPAHLLGRLARIARAAGLGDCGPMRPAAARP